MGSLNISTQLALITPGHRSPHFTLPFALPQSHPSRYKLRENRISPRTAECHPLSAPAQANPSSKAPPFPAPSRSLRDVSVPNMLSLHRPPSSSSSSFSSSSLLPS